jgi:hypothetical protein
MSHPDEQVSKEYRDSMDALARDLDAIFNGPRRGKDRNVCFTLLVTDFNKSSRVNYISNGNRADVVNMLKEVIARFEGQPEMSGKA